MRSHRVTCHPAEVTFHSRLYFSQLTLLLDLATSTLRRRAGYTLGFATHFYYLTNYLLD